MKKFTQLNMKSKDHELEERIKMYFNIFNKIF